MTTSSRIKWYPPLDAIKGDATELDLAAATPVREVLLRLQAEEPRLQKFFRMKPDSATCSGLIILKGGDILKLDDTIAPGDELEIMAAIEGGRRLIPRVPTPLRTRGRTPPFPPAK